VDNGLVTLVLKDNDLFRVFGVILNIVEELDDKDEMEQMSLKPRGSSFKNSTAALTVTNAKLIYEYD
jgi:hypothetical protein